MQMLFIWFADFASVTEMKNAGSILDQFLHIYFATSLVLL